MSHLEPKDLLERIRSAHIVRVWLVYAGVSWGVIESLDILTSHFNLPDWFFPAGLVLLLLGLPIVTITALLQARRLERSGTAGAIEAAAGDESGFWDAARGWFTWRRALLAGVVAFLALASVGLAVVLVRHPTRDLKQDVIAVMPFHAVGPGFELWSEGLVDLLSTALDGTDAFRSADPRAVLIRWKKVVGAAGDLGTREQAAEVAGRLRAGRMILGSLIPLGPGEVRLVADLYDVRQLTKDVSVALDGRETEMAGLVDRLTIELLKSIWEEGPLPDVRVSAITTTSVPALRAYLQGEQAFRRSRLSAATEAFRRAVELDSTFALAAHGLSLSTGWSNLEEEHAAAVDLAARHSAGLPTRDSLLITGYKLIERDGGLDAVPLYERLTQRYPDDFEAWYGLGEAIFHQGHEVGYHLDRAIDALERAYAIDSTMAPTLFHGIQSAYILDDTARARRWSTLYLTLDSTSTFAQALRLAGALRLGPPDEAARAAAALDTLRGEVLDRIPWFAPAGFSSLPYSELVWRAEADERFPVEVRSSRLRALGREHLRHGQIARWLEVEGEAISLDGGGHDLFLLTAARLAGILADPVAIALQEHLAAEASYPEEATYLAALFAQQGRLAEAQAAINWLERSAQRLAAGDSLEAQRDRGSALAYRGHIAAARGDTTAAVDLLRRGVALIPPDWAGLRALHRYTLAGLESEAGDQVEALRIFRALRHAPPVEALGYLHAARLYERRGDDQEALRYYTWFIQLWADADPYLQPYVDSARSARSRLASEQPTT
jgi:hypothetical protein